MGEPVVQLHNHSDYSILDGRSRVRELVDAAVRMGHPAVALTDHGNMYGAMEFYRVAREAGVKPILGVEAYVATGPMNRRDAKLDGQGSSTHLTVLAMNEAGYHNCLKLVSRSHMEGFYYKPRIDFDLLAKHSEGLVVLSGCLGGEVPQLVLAGRLAEAEACVRRYRELLGPERYFLEVHDHGLDKQKVVNKWMLEASRRLDVQAVAACDSHYVEKRDARSHDIMLAIQTASSMSDEARFRMTPYGEYYFRSGEQMYADWNGAEHVVVNTLGIGEMCTVVLDHSKVVLPEFEVPSGETPDTWLAKQVHEGLAWRYGSGVTQEHRSRVAYELRVIAKTGYARYFLIVQDYVMHARKSEVMAVPRGSVAGSLCVYALGICDIDPVKYDIMFERFLHDERKGMPDVDMDFCDDRRDDVIAYVTGKYGADRVAHIGTFGTLGARAAIKDVARVLDMDFGETNALTRAFPFGPDVTVASARETAGLQEAVARNPRYEEVLDIAEEIEGLVRGFGTHAAGMLISATALEEVVPIQLPPERGKRKALATAVTQWDNNNATSVIESIGLSKFDFLGLANLTVIREACRKIRDRHGIDLYGQSGEKLYSDLPMDYGHPMARTTYDMLAAGETTAVFQLESPGMRRALRLVKPTRIEDLPAIVALFRPGPMEQIPVFASAKGNAELIPRYDPRIDPLLAETYGIVTYQDQVLLIAREVAGFTWGEVDVLRKGMGKKRADVIEQQRTKFLSGAVANGYGADLAQELWDTMAPFAGYGFNKAHAYCYGVIAYITAFLKVNFPAEYMAAVLTQEAGNVEKVIEAIAESRRLGVRVLPPDINESLDTFVIVDDPLFPESSAIRFGFTGVANMGEASVQSILNGRNGEGRFHSFEDFVRIVDTGAVNSRVLGNLVKAGAFDEWGERNALLDRIPGLLEAKKRNPHGSLWSQLDMFGSSLPQLVRKVAPLDQAKRLEYEKEVLGMYVSAHPLDDIRNVLERSCTAWSIRLPETDNTQVIIGGIITKKRTHPQRNGRMMAFFDLEDLYGTTSVMLFADAYESFRQMVELERKVIVEGVVRIRDEQATVMATKLMLVQETDVPRKPLAKDCFWNISVQSVPKRIGILCGLVMVSIRHMGTNDIRLRIAGNSGVIVIPLKLSDEGVAQYERMLGQ